MVVNDIVVSVLCTVFNHEEYIRQCLDGFVTQKTEFRFEVIVHDDASTDSTANILKEYSERYPDIIKPIYQKVNQYSQGVNIFKKWLLPVAKGRYIAICEGDDFWSDENKLQMQIEALERNDSCCMSVHGTKVTLGNSCDFIETFPMRTVKQGIITCEEMSPLKFIKNFRTSSFVFRRRIFDEYYRNMPSFAKLIEKWKVSDQSWMMFFTSKGGVYYIDRFMSVYRRGVVVSWSNNQAFNTTVEEKIKKYRDYFSAYQQYDVYTNGLFHGDCLEEESECLFQAAILNCSAIEFLKGENRTLFEYLSVKRKLIIFVAMIFPKYIRNVTLHRRKNQADKLLRPI